ncbi:hypothetical protein ACFFHT_04290 [Gallibacterium melopsittaci]|uniref:Uncharacterized protein n=1 Tax=Gallibacterium melopsittaci TaxID=516063 RepID=A0ABV6HV92_9PAST
MNSIISGIKDLLTEAMEEAPKETLVVILTISVAWMILNEKIDENDS